MRLLIRLVLSTLAVLVSAKLLRGVHIDEWTTGIIVAVVLGLVNTFIRPLLILFTLPVTLISLGLFILVINAGMVMLVDRWIDGFSVDGFWWALGFSMMQWAVQGFLNALEGGGKKPKEELR
ncbi:MAG: phage holin family protein [Flavobacteriales bacterium]